MDVPSAIGALMAFAIGACIGSFVNTVAYRLPREISIITPPSSCPHCSSPIPWWANVPIFGYVGLRGRCICCGASIPFRYFLTELALATAAAYLYLNFSPLDALARYTLCTALFIVALIDYDWRLIPSIITFPGIPLGVLAAWLVMPEVGWKSSLAGIAIGAGFLFLTGEAYLRLRHREGVGMGDVWLLGMVGAFLGWPGAFFTLFVGSALGALGGFVMLFSGQPLRPSSVAVEGALGEVTEDIASAEAALSPWQTPIPFGPFLALAAGIFALFQPALVEWYLR